MAKSKKSDNDCRQVSVSLRRTDIKAIEKISLIKAREGEVTTRSEILREGIELLAAKYLSQKELVFENSK